MICSILNLLETPRSIFPNCSILVKIFMAWWPWQLQVYICLRYLVPGESYHNLYLSKIVCEYYLSANRIKLLKFPVTIAVYNIYLFSRRCWWCIQNKLLTRWDLVQVVDWHWESCHAFLKAYILKNIVICSYCAKQIYKKRLKWDSSLSKFTYV